MEWTWAKTTSCFERTYGIISEAYDASSPMKNVFVDYHTIFQEHGLSWIVEEQEEVAVKQVLSMILPRKLQSRLESDTSFAYNHFKKLLLKISLT